MATLASGSNNLTTYYAKRIIGDSNAQTSATALLQTGTNITANLWILGNTAHTTYGIKYVYDSNSHDKLEAWGGGSAATAWVQLDNGNTYILGQVGIGYNPNTSGNTYKLYVNGTSYFTNTAYFGNGTTYYISANGSEYSGNAATATRIKGNLAQATSDANRNIWVSSTASADGIPNYVTTFTMNPSTKTLHMPSGGRIDANGGALYLGNSNNASWVYVQDMASQASGTPWKLTQAGAFTCTSINDSGAATISGGITSQHGHIFNVAGNEFNWIPDGYNSTMWFNYESFNRTNNSTVSEYICGNGKHGHANLRAAKVYNAVWNDFAEYREGTTTEAGRVVAATADSNKVTLTTERLQPCAHVISDTFGCSVGESDTAKTPIGVAGRVLVFPYRSIEEYNIGDCLCAAPGGTADIMTREEIIMYPDRIIGIVDEIPKYKIWNQILTTAKPEDKDKITDGGCGQTATNIQVKGRIWIYAR